MTIKFYRVKFICFREKCFRSTMISIFFSFIVLVLSCPVPYFSLLADLCLLMLEERKCTKTNNRPLCNTISFLAACCCCCWQHSEIYLGEKKRGETLNTGRGLENGKKCSFNVKHCLCVHQQIFCGIC